MQGISLIIFIVFLIGFHLPFIHKPLVMVDSIQVPPANSNVSGLA